MTPEVKKAMLEYEQIKLNTKVMEARLEELKEVIMPHVEAGKKYEGQEGTFEVVEKASWRFTPKVVDMREALKVAEEDEKARGVAINNPTVYIKYTVKK